MKTNKKKMILFTLSAFLLLCLSLSVLVYGADNTEQTFTVGMSDGLKYLDKLTSKVWFKGDLWGLSAETNYLINNFIQAFFWIPKFFFRMFGSFYVGIQGASEVTKSFIRLALDFSSTIFTTLFGSGKESVGAIVLGVIVLRSLVALVYNGSFFRELFKGLLLVLACLVLFTKTSDGYFIEKLYTRMDSGLSSLTTNLKTSVDESSLVEQTGGATVTGLEDYYFEETVWKTYKYMNFDYREHFEPDNPEGSYEVFEDADGTVFQDEDFTSLVFYDSGDDNFQVRGDVKIGEFVGKEDKIKNHMMAGQWGKKATYILASFVDIIVLGLIINIIALSGFVLGLLIILLLILGVFSAFVSIFFPKSGALVEWAKRLFTTMFLANFLYLVGILFVWLYNLVGVMLMRVGLTNVFAVAVAKALILYYLFRNRSFLIGAITGNGLKLKTNSRLKGLGSFGRKKIQEKQNNAKAKLANARKSAKSKLGTAVKGTALVGAGVKSVAMRRLKQTGFGTVVGNKLRKNKVLDLASMAGDGVATVGNRVSAFKDKAMAKAYEISAEGLSSVDDSKQKEIYQDKAKRYRKEAESKIKTKSSGYDTRKRNRIAVRRGELRIPNGVNLTAFRARNQKEMALKNKERIQKGLNRRNRIASVRKDFVSDIDKKRSNYIHEVAKIPHTKQRLQALRSQREISKPNVNRSKFYHYQNDLPVRMHKIEAGKQESIRVKRERAEERLKQKRVNRQFSPTVKPVEESVIRFRSPSAQSSSRQLSTKTLTSTKLSQSSTSSTTSNLKTRSNSSVNLKQNVVKAVSRPTESTVTSKKAVAKSKQNSSRTTAKHQPVVKGVKATKIAKKSVTPTSTKSNIRMRKNR